MFNVTNILASLTGASIIFLIGVFVGTDIGNKYGSNARLYADAVQQLSRKNAATAADRPVDQLAIEQRERQIDATLDKASAIIMKYGPCPAAKEVRDVLNDAGNIDEK